MIRSDGIIYIYDNTERRILMKICSPEQAGIKSSDVKRFYEFLDECNLSTHSVIMARGDSIFSECYYSPFNSDFLHRMYSVSKSFVSVAVGFCIQDGLVSLDDRMEKFFPEYTECEWAFKHTSTVRDLLMMESDMTGVNWFRQKPADRASVYFKTSASKKPGTLFDYDSSGSYMLGVIVEKLTGKPFLKYLQEKVLDDIGFSKGAYCIKAPGGYSFSDSGVMCTARDLLLFARFVMNGGTWEGKRYLNEEYLRRATDMKISNNDYGFIDHGSFGYGYLIWGAPGGCYAMLGMGNQIALCDPKHDFIFIINSDNQGNSHGYEEILTALYTCIISNLTEDGSALHDNVAECDALALYLKEKKLFCLKESRSSHFSDKINRVVFVPDQNPMGIKWFRLEFDGDEGVLFYENEQGKKSFRFGFGHNVFMKFPQVGYSDLVANTFEEGNTYDAAFSADWPEERKLRIRVQIIDKYFGNLAIVFGFKDEKEVSVRMSKTAEDFLSEYSGVMNASADAP